MRRTTLHVGVPAYSFIRMGLGLHTGATTKVMVRAGSPWSGIRFSRADVAGRPVVPAAYRYVTDTERATTLGLGAAEVRTVEHLMAALFIAGAWDTQVECFGPEVPLLDGSLAPWLEALKENELYRHGGGSTHVLRLKDTVEIEGRGWWCKLVPAVEPRLTLSIDFPNPGVGKQKIDLPLTQDAMEKELATARTFGFREEVAKLIDSQLIKGADLQRAVLFEADGKVATPGGLRFKDEPVRHKAVDLIGDLALLGAPLMAHVTAHGTGHAAHREIMWTLQERDVLERVSAAA